MPNRSSKVLPVIRGGWKEGLRSRNFYRSTCNTWPALNKKKQQKRWTIDAIRWLECGITSERGANSQEMPPATKPASPRPPAHTSPSLVLSGIPFFQPHCCASSSASVHSFWFLGHQQTSGRTQCRIWYPQSSLPTSSPPPGCSSPVSLGHSHNCWGCPGCRRPWQRVQPRQQ